MPKTIYTHRRGDCDCRRKIEDFEEDEIIDHLEESGYMVIKCMTIIDKMKLEKLKEAMEL